MARTGAAVQMARSLAIRALVTILALPWLSSSAVAQEAPASAWQGIDGWVMLLRGRGMRLLEAWPAAGERPDRDWLLIVFGRPPADATLAEQIVQHAAHGGDLLVASDRPEINPILGELGAQLSFDAWKCARAEDALHGYPECPLVTPGKRAGLFRDVARVAMNRPAFFTRAKGWKVLARLPESRGGGPRRACVLERQDSARQILISDHSLFINLMLREAANLAFATNLVDRFGPRPVLLVADGQIVHTGMFPQGFPDPGLNFSVRLLDRAVRGVEESGRLRDLDPRIVAAIYAAASVLLAAGLCVWLWRRPTDGSEFLAGASALLRRFGPDGEPTAESAGRRDLRIPAQELATTWWKRFRARRHLAADTPLDAAHVVPPGAGLLARRAWSRDVALLATALTARAPVSPAAFQHLVEAARRIDGATSQA